MSGYPLILVPVIVLVGWGLFVGLLVLGISGLLKGLEPHDGDRPAREDA